MEPLVYDIGLHNGGDTRQYLKEGCRVIAIDANPAMCTAAAAEFQPYIDSKRLTILNCGAAERAGKLEFWICDDVTEWSSFDREFASRNGAKHRYRRFKVICQNKMWEQVTENNLWCYRLGQQSRLMPLLRKMNAISRRITGRQAIIKAAGEFAHWMLHRPGLDE